ncbi:putative storage protein LPV [Phytophthora cinnamomi]|uniref:putative storage protein LPV n=1 Tax=Phytophthora cinnamomi TaxID=4785 RepID=UPI00355A0DB8|nr:putative storage protein LPV [Phytophthora cinnamomi]
MRFIRRVAAPDRLNKKRRQKKRLAVAGATIGLLAASAGVGYATMRASNASSDVKSAKLEASMANDMFVSKLGDAFHPSDFDQIDTDGDGELSKDEILADLNDKETADVKRVMTSDLPDDIKSNLVKAGETDDGVKMVVPDADGNNVVVTVPDVPDEIAASATEDTQVVNVVTPSGDQQQVVIEGQPEDGTVTIGMVDDSGEVTTQEVKAVETDDGMKVVVPTDDGGYVPVVVPNIPDDIQQEIVEEVPEEPLTGSNFMTKDEFRQWIAQRYEDTLTELKKEEQRLEDEEAEKAGRVSQLEDCIEQAANKFGYYGVYEQPPHYQNAVDWVENDCLAGKWQPERRMLRR